jgi:hypothetical protein
LKLILQKNISGTWTDERVVVNTTITIPALGLIKLDTGKDNFNNQIIFAGWNNLNVSASSAGDYRVYAKFEAYSKIFEANWEFIVA